MRWYLRQRAEKPYEAYDPLRAWIIRLSWHSYAENATRAQEGLAHATGHLRTATRFGHGWDAFMASAEWEDHYRPEICEVNITFAGWRLTGVIWKDPTDT